LGAGSQVCEHGEHAAMGLRVPVEPELEEDVLHVRLDGPLGYGQPSRNRLVRQPLGDQPQNLPLAVRQLVEGVLTPTSADEARDDRWIDYGLAVGEATDPSPD
jgi:hypothetical protein